MVQNHIPRQSESPGISGRTKETDNDMSCSQDILDQIRCRRYILEAPLHNASHIRALRADDKEKQDVALEAAYAVERCGRRRAGESR